MTTKTQKKPELHPSRMETMMRCGMQYFWRYVEGIKSPPGVAAYIGTATHKSVEANLRSKKETGKPIPKDEAVDIAVDALKNEWTGESPTLGEDEKALGAKAVRGRAADMAGVLSALHHDQVAPKITPVHVERPFKLELEGFPFDLAGRLDVQEKDAVGDTKTKARTPGADDAHKSLQLTTYSLAVKTLDGKNPKGVYLDFLVKSKVPKSVRLQSARCDEDYKVLLRQVELTAKVIETGAFYPVHPDNWICSKKFCGYWDEICPYGRRRCQQF